MLNPVEVGILDGCADSEEIFYFLFTEVNYGGQLTSNPARKSGIRVTGEEVPLHARRLISSGMLRCWRVSDDPGARGPFLTPEEQVSGLYRERVEITEPGEREFDAYRGYDCLTFEDHMQRFGYGPHEFSITQSGIDEIERPEYEALHET